MSQRLTGKAAIAAKASDSTRLAQKRNEPSVAFIAPGITTITRLSTISMTVIEAVSEAKASPAARRKPIPVVSSGRAGLRFGHGLDHRHGDRRQPRNGGYS